MVLLYIIAISCLFGMNQTVVAKPLDQDGCLTAKIEKVDQCPHSKHDWELQSKIKMCSNIILPCLNHNLKYHCLINTWRNETFSICAIPDYIIGYHCAEFNVKGSRLQPNYYTDCKNFSVSCPFKYLSTQAFKYQECYNLVNNKETSDSLKKTNRHGNPDSQNKSQKLPSYDAIFFLVLLFFALIWNV